MTAEELLLLFERVGFTFLTRFDSPDAWGRSGVAWSTLLLERPALHGTARPIDQLATVLGNREKKVATYKLALLRALNDLAATQPHLARWRDDGRVAIPATAIAERWIRYYWPLLDASQFLPQQQGDHLKQRHTLGFAPQLLSLISSYRHRNGLDGFEFDLAMGQLEDRSPLHAAALRRMKDVIRAGPVKYAGRALRDGRLFEWEGGDVLVSSPLWRELSLLSHWICDSLVLRWAELMARMSQGQVGVDHALPLLLPRPPLARDTELLRALYLDAPVPCVWSGRKVHAGQLAIDHVIPWSLWRNNDLWNLVPSLASINQKKSDQLPSRRLLRERTSAIKDTWSLSLETWPDRFRREAQRHIPGGVTSGALVDALFDSLVESVETLRLQRGLEAWDGPASRAA
ncbi:MAG: hypothetical protein FJ086_03485 [Deltaproteobacteria bacterium]|nr:hypothetical protein [Deltaproteobacteria bacterium]